MRNVDASTKSPDIVLIPAQGRNADAVHQDVQAARKAAQQIRDANGASKPGGLGPGVKEDLVATLRAAQAARDSREGMYGPDPDAPCPIP
jgi:hypothetical protein